MQHIPFTLRALAPVLAATALLAAPAAQAQVAGQWSAKVGINQISPQVKSDDLSAPAFPGSKIDIKAATSVIVTATYAYTDHLTVEAFGGLPYRHKVVGAGSVDGVGKLGTIRQISPTVLGQYRFMEPSAMLRPYVGAGVTYAQFYGSEGSAQLTAITNPGGPATVMKNSHAFGVTGQLGVTLKLDTRWYADFSLLKTKIATTSPLSTGQSIHVKLDPVSTGVSLGYRF